MALYAPEVKNVSKTAIIKCEAKMSGLQGLHTTVLCVNAVRVWICTIIIGFGSVREKIVIKLLRPIRMVGVGMRADELVGELLSASVVPESALVLDRIETIGGTIWKLPVE